MDTQEAFYLEVLENNKERILRICSFYAGSTEEQKDLFQDVVLQIWKSISSFRGEACISTWVYRISLNTCMKRFSEKRKDKERKKVFEHLQWIDAIPEKPDERFEYLRQCIVSLPQADQMVITLFLEDLAYAEIGDIVGISENHVAVKMKRIKEKLFNCISKKL